MRAPEFWTATNASSRRLATLLSPLGELYGAVTDWKRVHTRSHRARAKVICVGNLTAGGSGKTPVTAEIAARLLARNKRAFILTRGYGGSMEGSVLVDPTRHTAMEVGDEPLLLAARAPAIVSRDRRKGAALADQMGGDVIVMDDGYQNFTLAKDLSLVVVDGETGFGNGRLLPAGPLRERVVPGLARASAAIVMGDGFPSLAGFSGPVLRARLAPENPEDFAGRPVFAFAGIGRPEKFFASLSAAGAELRETRAFADHHAYTAAELSALASAAQTLGLRLATTEKDFVRLPQEFRADIHVLRVRARFEDPSQIDSILDRCLEN
jgi:tetraacyldisaccharide 4'-kinase